VPALTQPTMLDPTYDATMQGSMTDLRATRREALRLAAAAACIAVVPPSLNAQANPTMLTRPIPSTKEPLPVVGVGTWQTFDVGDDRAAREERKEVLRILFEAGGRVIDSSPMYGRAEAVVGTLLSEMQAQRKAFLATKVWTSGEKAGIQQMQASLAKLRAPAIDLMQIHNLVDWRTHLATLRAWKERKTFRYIGITHYTVPGLDELAVVIRAEPIDFVQFAYSINVREAEARLLPLAAERGVAVIANQPFDSGALFRQVRGKPLPEWAAELGCASWAQVFLKFILGHPAVTCVIPGTARPDHMRDNIAAGLGRLPDAAERRRMAQYWDGQ
jgi:diketogulonate reductase-like aldo/keto reductase